MTESTAKQEWILLIHQLPPKPTNLRVRAWRKLRKLGAVSIKNSVYVLPLNEKTCEDFEWLKQEIESSGGEAIILRAGSVEGKTDEEIIMTFRKEREEEYAGLISDLDGLTAAIREQKRRGHLSVGRIGKYEGELERLRRDLDRLTAIDFFAAPGRQAALRAYERCHSALRATQDSRKEPATVDSSNRPPLNPAQFQGRRWVTRRNLFIDRLASIWLIKRFIDERARFSFIGDSNPGKGAVAFDMYGTEFTHRGEDCTFETLIKQFGLNDDPGLRGISEIVHDIDLKDQKFNRLEAAGVTAVIRGLAGALRNDRKLARQCAPLFDGLYDLLSQSDEKALQGKDGGRQNQDRAGKSLRRKRGTGR